MIYPNKQICLLCDQEFIVRDFRQELCKSCLPYREAMSKYKNASKHLLTDAEKKKVLTSGYVHRGSGYDARLTKEQNDARQKGTL